MKNKVKTALPQGPCAAAAGLLLGLYPALSGLLFAKVLGVFCLFYSLSILISCLKDASPLSASYKELLAAAVLLLLGLLCFINPAFLLRSLPFAAGAVLIVYAILRIPMIAERWAGGTAARLGAALWVLIPLGAGALLVFHPFRWAVLLIRISGLLLLLYGLADIISGRTA